MPHHASRFRRSLITPALVAICLAAPAIGLAAEPLLPINIDAGPLKTALRAYALQTHQQLIYDDTVLAGRQSPALKGRYTSNEALQRLLSGVDVEVQHAGTNVLVIKAHTVAPPRSEDLRPIAASSAITTAPAAAIDAAQADALRDPDPSAAPQTNTLNEVVVTGTHIRGVTAIASPTVTISQDDLTRYGDATVADALQRLPENFAGTATPVTAAVGSDRTGTNDAFSQGVNLRGLGANATLVLLNGRRLGGSGIKGDFTDVSAIPAAAVDHVEVLLDGASAVYGSDAVGGVVNIITKHAFSGAETSVRFGEDAGGHGPSLQASQTFGLTWVGGSLLLAYTYQRDGALPAYARRYTADSDLTSLGGTNMDSAESSPGNILAYSPSAGAYVSTYAIPNGSGLGLTPASFTSGATNYTNYRAGTDVSPNQNKNGLYLNATQALDSHMEVNIEGRYNLRSYQDAGGATQTLFTVTNRNPYFVSPDGSTSELIGYSALNALGPNRETGRSKSYDLTVGFNRDFLKTWKLEAYAGVAGESNRDYEANIINSDHLDEALGNAPADPQTSFSTAIDGFFNPYGSGASNNKTVLGFVGDGFVRSGDDDDIATFSVQADGDLFKLPAGAVKAAFGAQFRHERYESSTEDGTGSTPSLEGYTAYHRDVAALFGELNIPVIGEDTALPGVRRLSLSVAGRVEHYDDVGTTANPKIGLVWQPIKDLSVHSSYGTSFRAPGLFELHEPAVIDVLPLPNGTSRTLSLVEIGGNPNLKPETATSWTAGVDWTPHAIIGLRLGASWFNIDYTNRINNPGGAALATVLIDPAYSSLVTHLTSGDAADIALVNARLATSTSPTAKLYPASAFGAIVDAGYLNVAALLVSGVDLNGRYAIDVGPNHVTLLGSATYLYNYRQQTLPSAQPEQLVSTAGEPVDWRVRATAVWARGPYDAALTINYVDRYWDPANKRSIDSWTTADLTLTWRSPATEGPTRGLTINAAVQNLLDQDPPFYNAYYGIGYDPANANPLGRVVSVQMTKRW